MADQSDVENALVALAVNALYPNGTTAASVPGPDCVVYRGWPNSAALDRDLAAGRINVTIFPMGEPGRNTTRYAPRWQSTPVSPTLTVSVSGVSATFAGTAGIGQLAGILLNGIAYVYRTTASDTPATVAANLATAIRANHIVTLSGTTLTIPGTASIAARVVADASATREVRRQEQGIRITCWCPDPGSRDAAATAIDLGLAAYPFVGLDDGTQARLRYRGTLVFDQSQDALLYRRDLLFDVEYATTVSALQPAMLFGDLILNAGTFIA